MNVLAFGTTGGEDVGLVTITVVNFGILTETVDLAGRFHESYELGQVVVVTDGGNNEEG